MLQHGFRDHGIKGIVFEGQKMPVRDDVNFWGRFDFEVDNIRGTAVVASTEI